MKKEYPLYYHYRKGDNDQKFVLDRMYFIPDDLKDEVSNHYERIFMDGKVDNRGRANRYLHSEAMKYKTKSSRASL